MLKFNQREPLSDNAKFLALPYFTNLYLSQAFRWVILLLCFKKKKNQNFWMGLNKNANCCSYESRFNEVTQAGWEVSKQWFLWISDPEDTAKSHCELLIKSSCCSLGVSLLGIQVSRVSKWILSDALVCIRRAISESKGFIPLGWKWAGRCSPEAQLMHSKVRWVFNPWDKTRTSPKQNIPDIQQHMRSSAPSVFLYILMSAVCTALLPKAGIDFTVSSCFMHFPRVWSLCMAAECGPS